MTAQIRNRRFKTIPSQGDEVPPHSEEFEAAALGCLVADPEGAAERCGSLCLGDFYDLRHRVVFEAVSSILREGLLPDTLVLANRLKSAGKLDDAGGLAYVSGFPDKTPSPANFAFYLPDLRDYRLKRELLRLCTQGSEIARKSNGNFTALVGDYAATVQSIAAGADTGAGLTIRSAGEIAEMDLPANDNLLGDRLLAKGQPLVIAGAGGLGKSRLMLQLAACTITGRPFCGLEVHSGPVKWLIFQVENSIRRLKDDLRAIELWLGRDWPLVRENLQILDVATDLDSIVSLGDPAAVSRMRRAIETINPDLVAFDALGDFLAGDPNSDQDMRGAVTSISRLVRVGRAERCPVVLHHALTGKSGAARATGWDRSGFARNSKVLHAWTRGQINVAPGSPDSNETLVLACGKCSNGREFAPFAVRLNPATMIYDPAPDFDLSAWQSEVRGTKHRDPLVTLDRVRALALAPIPKVKLAKVIMDDCGCSKATAYRHIADAEKAGKIRTTKGGDYVAKL